MTTATTTYGPGRRRKNRRHAGQEDVMGLALVLALLVLIVFSLALLPFLPWGALVTLVSTGIVAVVMGRRMAHHTGDRWRPVAEVARPVEDVVEPTRVLSPAGEVEDVPVQPHRHRKLTRNQWKLLGWGVIAVLWLRNVRDRQMLDDDRLDW